jgi:hypothetical protein
MNDINWRDINEDHTCFEPEYWRWPILVKTDITIRQSCGYHICWSDKNGAYRDESCNENVSHYAFINQPQ